ncbi:MAG: iron-containing alcohol dehydrogenase [Lentisphaeria bacterium]|nr:iron-containing alcohol dehydrogenase [Lentisphaeria bacterium]
MQFLYPSEISFEKGLRHNVAKRIKELDTVPKKITVFSGSGSYANEILTELKNHFTVQIINGLPTEPSIVDLDELLSKTKGFQPELILGIGGGSVIDTAKAVALLTPYPKSARFYFNDQSLLKHRGIPFVAMPTTAGSGAEITKNSVFRTPDGSNKLSLRSKYMIATNAWIDPELTYTCPYSITFHSGMDALTQAIEASMSRKRNEATESLAIEAVKLCISGVEGLLINLNNADSRDQLAKGSLLAALAFSQTGLGAVHGLAHPIGAKYKVPHGLCCAVLLPHILKINILKCKEKFKVLDSLNDGVCLYNKVLELNTNIGIPTDFKKWNISNNDFLEIIRLSKSNSMSCNPFEMKDEDILDILTELTK